MKNQFEILEEKYPATCIVQLRGNFYNAFNDSAVVLSALREYKLKPATSGYKCGFPETVLSSVMEDFEKNHINFMAFNNGDVVIEKSFEDNRFKEYLEANAPITEIKADTDKKENIKEEIVGSNLAACKKQFVSMLTGNGLSIEDCLSDIKNRVQKNIDENNIRVVSLSIVNGYTGNAHGCALYGILIYEQQ